MPNLSILRHNLPQEIRRPLQVAPPLLIDGLQIGTPVEMNVILRDTGRLFKKSIMFGNLVSSHQLAA